MHHLSCDYHKSSDELLEDLKADLDPEEGQPSRLTVQRMESLSKSIQPGIEALQTLFKRGSFVSAEDFRVTFEEVGEVVEGKWITPRPLKSRTTSFGRPDHQLHKHNQVNDLISVASSSYKTQSSKPPVSHGSVDSSYLHQRGTAGFIDGMRPLLDNAAISPAPVSRFAPKTVGMSLNQNRVTLPFNKANSFAGHSVDLNEVSGNG